MGEKGGDGDADEGGEVEEGEAGGCDEDPG